MSLIEKLNSEQKKAFEELRLRMKNDLPPDMSPDHIVYYKYLKARDFDVDKAEKMLKKTIKWRKTYQMSTLLEDFEPKEVFTKYVEPNALGFDKDGDMVIYSAAGNMDTNDILRCLTRNQYMMHLMWVSEKCIGYWKEEYEKTGREAHQMILIFDLNKLTLSNATSKSSAEVLLGMNQAAQDHCPETVKAIYVINAPSYYVFMFSILKTVMAIAVIQKISVFSHSGWRETLVKNIGADILPAFLGGNRTDPDGNPLCTTFINHGGKISPMYYLSDEDRYFKRMSQVEKVLVPPKEKREIPVEVAENGTKIQWQFLVDGKDIGFGLNFRTSEQDEEELLPVEKYSTPDGTVNGSYKCKSIGKYVIIFDNSYSWMRSKEVSYSVIVIKDR